LSWGDGMDLRDAIGVAGLVMLAAGLCLISVPLALVVVGGLLFAIAYLPTILPIGGGVNGHPDQPG